MIFPASLLARITRITATFITESDIRAARMTPFRLREHKFLH
jgi:hypothetical protein